MNIKHWGIFSVGELFNIYKPQVYHTHEVKEKTDGVPYVIRSKFNNGIRYRVDKKRLSTLNPAGVISFGAENASFFYQAEEWCSGRDMYYIDTRHLSMYACLFLISCLRPICAKYSYSYGLFPDLLGKEKIRIPITKDGNPYWSYMENYMKEVKLHCQSKSFL